MMWNLLKNHDENISVCVLLSVFIEVCKKNYTHLTTYSEH